MSEHTGDSIPNESRNAKAEAKAAKAYAKASRPWYKMKRWWLVAVIVVMFIAGAAGGGDSGDEAPVAAETTTPADPTASEEPSAAEEEPAPEEPAAEEEPVAANPIAVEATKIVKEFEQNELAADAKYKGEDLKITGRIAKIDTDVWDDDKYILSLGGKWDFLTVDCYDMSTDELSTLKTGQTVTVLGTFDDGGDLGVEVKDCRLP